MESAGVTLKFLPPLVCVCLPIKAGYKEDHWIQTMFSSVTSAHFHFHMWECVDMKQQSLSVLSIQHEKQFPTDSRTTHDSSCFSFCPDNTACTMTGGWRVQSACEPIPLWYRIKSITHYSTQMHWTHKQSIVRAWRLHYLHKWQLFPHTNSKLWVHPQIGPLSSGGVL